MKLRKLRHRATARMLFRVRLWARGDDPWWHDCEDFDEFDEDRGCTRCGGEGFCQVDDPFWDDCDEFGEGPCNACGGTGRRADQTVF